MQRVIINNSAMKRTHTYLKSVILTKDEFYRINKRIDERYARLEQKGCFGEFYSWTLLATVLGIFTHYGDNKSTRFFLNCLRCGYLPEISIVKNKSNVRICICIMEKKLDERRAGLESTAK